MSIDKTKHDFHKAKCMVNSRNYLKWLEPWKSVQAPLTNWRGIQSKYPSLGSHSIWASEHVNTSALSWWLVCFFGKHHAKPQKIEWLHRIQATFGNVPPKAQHEGGYLYVPIPGFLNSISPKHVTTGACYINHSACIAYCSYKPHVWKTKESHIGSVRSSFPTFQVRVSRF